MAWRGITVAAGVVAMVVGGGAAALYATDRAPWDPEAGRTPVPLIMPTDRPDPAWKAAGDILGSVASSDPEQAQRLADAVSAELSAWGVDDQVGAQVVDLATGDVVYSQAADTPMTPASVQKLLTCTAVLGLLGPDHVFTTSVVAGQDDPARLVLVGGGDPMLRSDDADGFTSYRDLAKATAEELVANGITQVGLDYDDTMFSGSGVDPDWEPGYVSEGIVSPVSALSVDGGRISPTSRTRAADPAATAAATFANLLEEHGVEVTGTAVRVDVDDLGDTDEIASIDSPPLSDIVAYDVLTSNNDVAETLGRHVAVASGRSGTSDDVEEAVTETLTDLGVDMSSADVRDGSGLSRRNLVAAATVVEVLEIAGSGDHPRLRPVITGLPVAGFTGTLAERFTDDDSAPGLVRAKTGTLTQGGVHSLAGVALSQGGSGYAFAVIANDVSPSSALSVRAALDAITSAITG